MKNIHSTKHSAITLGFCSNRFGFSGAFRQAMAGTGKAVTVVVTLNDIMLCYTLG